MGLPGSAPSLLSSWFGVPSTAARASTVIWGFPDAASYFVKQTCSLCWFLDKDFHPLLPCLRLENPSATSYYIACRATLPTKIKWMPRSLPSSTCSFAAFCSRFSFLHTSLAFIYSVTSPLVPLILHVCQDGCPRDRGAFQGRTA